MSYRRANLWVIHRASGEPAALVVIDTNVVSELMRAEPSSKVLAWMDDRPAQELFVTAVTEAEVYTGIALLPAGRCSRSLEEGCERLFVNVFSGRVLPFDSGAARACAEIVVVRRVRGRPVSQADAQIAAIAHFRGMAMATRNTRDFENMELALIDPWGGA